MHRAMHQVMLDELSNYELLGRRHTHVHQVEKELCDGFASGDGSMDSSRAVQRSQDMSGMPSTPTQQSCSH